MYAECFSAIHCLMSYIANGFDARTGGATSQALTAVDDVDDDENFEDLDEEDLDEALFGLNTAIATEKETAADALGELFEHTGFNFLPYVV